MAQTQRCEVNEVQLSVASRWVDTEGKVFVVDAVTTNGAEVWVSYCRSEDNTYYNCLIEAFTHRFKEIKQ
jgi:hypothetical protein